MVEACDAGDSVPLFPMASDEGYEIFIPVLLDINEPLDVESFEYLSN